MELVSEDDIRTKKKQEFKSDALASAWVAWGIEPIGLF